MALFFCFCLAVTMLVAVNADHGQCAGKCVPNEAGGIQGKVICLNNQFPGPPGGLDGKPHPSDLGVFQYFAYEDKEKRFYGKGFHEDDKGRTSSVEVVSLPEADPPVEYAVENGTKCRVGKPAMAHLSCIPKTATYLKSITLGKEGNNIHADLYVDHESWDNKPNDKKDGSVHVVMDDCTPVLIGFEGTAPDGKDRIMSLLIANVEPRITDLSVFDVPDACK